MIGVIADSAEHRVVREFFELFKTPWEFYQSGQYYDVVLCAIGADFEPQTAGLTVVYSSERTAFDDRFEVRLGRTESNTRVLSSPCGPVPIYGKSVSFAGAENPLLTVSTSLESVGWIFQSGGRTLARIGYDLFHEIRMLLTSGQPSANAGMPALELHIALLRNLIVQCGIPVVEIPPVPEGYSFIACLTHDVDHPSIRLHKLDHTVFGFLYRAVIGSIVDLVRGRKSFGDMLSNWSAAVKLPFIRLGLVKDFWLEFSGSYRAVEQGLPSTFFVIPFADRTGETHDGPAPKFRAARYGARDIADSIQKLQSAGCEIALHGIDAWLDSVAGAEEVEEIRRVSGARDVGVRMHWLYFDSRSPQTVENSGALYDSTVGYNGTVGYRAGTTQVYQPLKTSHLLELPLHVMDTALFFPEHLGLSPQQARKRIRAILANAARFGGCVTVNWHDRSMSPERLWGGCYRELINDLKGHDAWFATARDAAAWFRKRRSVVFESNRSGPERLRSLVAANPEGGLPGLQLRYCA